MNDSESPTSDEANPRDTRAGVRARVTVFPRREILDPQGRAIHQTLGRLGFDQVAEVRAGKSFDIRLRGDEADARQQLEEMARKLLSNPITEDFEIEIVGAES